MTDTLQGYSFFFVSLEESHYKKCLLKMEKYNKHKEKCLDLPIYFFVGIISSLSTHISVKSHILVSVCIVYACSPRSRQFGDYESYSIH